MSCFCLQVQLFVFFCYLCVNSAQIYHVVEELDSEQFLGNIAIDNNIPQSVDPDTFASLKFKFLSRDSSLSKLFKLDATAGDIFASSWLDREKVCGQAVQCSVELDIAVFAKGFFEIYTIMVVIEDINDNSPQFPLNETTLYIAESADIESSFVISGANDADEHGQNSDMIYNMTGDIDIFALDTRRRLTYTDIIIILKSPLDREKREFYELVIVARDSGIPQSTGSIFVHVVIQDVNDHTPEFIRDTYNVTIREDANIGEAAVTVSARDNDSGLNSHISYRLGSRTTQASLDVFRINDTTGTIFISKWIDYETVQSHRLIVEASDHGRARSLSSETLVIINVQDVNDNDPVIVFNFITAEDHAQISENANVGDFIAYLSVLDPDSDHNGAVSCSLQSDRFTLNRTGDNKYKVILSTALDREAVDEYPVEIVCSDSGNPPRSVTETFKIVILDENDHAPSFSQETYDATITENNPRGESIVQCSASDDDIGVNSDLNYYISNELQPYFIVNSKTGLIKANVSFDRETMEEITFFVYVKDGGTPALSASASIIVRILDENDNAPSFSKEIYLFDVVENSPVNITVGIVNASDSDLALSSKVSYRLSKYGDIEILTINPTTGIITASGLFDREVKSDYQLQVIAEDHGQHALSSSVTVRIHILDINDNDPVITYPMNPNSTVIASRHLLPMSPLTSVQAFDLDIGENGSLSYSIKTANCSGCYMINPNNGEIFLVKSIYDDIGSTYEIRVTVRDNGKIARQTQTLLLVTVEEEGIYGSPFINMTASGTGLNEKLFVILAVVVATVLVSAAIILGILIVRRKESRTILNKPVLDSSSMDSSQSGMEIDNKAELRNISGERGDKFQETISEEDTFTIPKRKTVSFMECDEFMKEDDFFKGVVSDSHLHGEESKDRPIHQDLEVTTAYMLPPSPIIRLTPSRKIFLSDRHRTYQMRAGGKCGNGSSYQSVLFGLAPLAHADALSQSSMDSDVTDSGKGGSVEGIPIAMETLIIPSHYV